MVYTRDNIDSFLRTRDQLSLLECLPYIEREYVDPTPTSIPLMELTDCPGVHFIRYTDLEKLSEVEEVSIQEAAIAVRDANLLTEDQFVIAMEEWRPLLDPSLINAFPYVILIKEVNTPVYQFCEDCMNTFMQTRDESYVDLFLEAPETLMEYTEDQLNKYIDALMKQNPKLTRNQAYDLAKRRLGVFDKKDSAMASMKNSAENGVQYAAEINRQTDQALGRKAPQQPQTPAQPTPQQTAPLRQSQPTQQPEQKGFWASKWAAFRNWMDGIGSNGDQKSTWFTNMANKVKSFFNGGAQTTRATNQQQQAQQNPTNSSTSNSKNAGVDAVVNVIGQHVMDTGAGWVDKLAHNINNFTQNKLGMDFSPFVQIGADMGKEYINQKIAQGMDVAKDKGEDMANAALDKAGDLLSQGYQKAKEVGKQGVEKVKSAINGGGSTTVTTREVSEDQVPQWAKDKFA